MINCQIPTNLIQDLPVANVSGTKKDSATTPYTESKVIMTIPSVA